MNRSLEGSFVGGPQRATPALCGLLPLNPGWTHDLFLTKGHERSYTLPVPDPSLKRVRKLLLCAVGSLGLLC